jgi:hypothetical protein
MLVDFQKFWAVHIVKVKFVDIKGTVQRDWLG